MQPITLSAFRSEFLPLYELPLRATATKDKMEFVLDQVEELGVGSTADLTTALVVRYIQARTGQVCNNTLRGELSYLRAATTYAYDEDWLDRLPRWKRLWPRASEPRLTGVHSIAEIGRVLQRLRHRAADWFEHRTLALGSLVAHTGVRRDEAVYAWREDFDLRAGIFFVRDRERLKTAGSAAPVPLCTDVVLDLTAWFARNRSRYALPTRTGDGPWNSGGEGCRPTGRLIAAGEAVDVMGLTCQSLRHAFATHGRRRFGIGALGMMDILRHECEETQETYVHREQVLAELVRLVRLVSYR